MNKPLNQPVSFNFRKALLLSLAGTILTTSAALSDLTLTPAGLAQGLSLSVFADGFPTNGSIGPLDMAFEPGGGVLVTDYPGNTRLFPTDTDGQHAGSIPVAQFYGFGNAVGLATLGGKTYMSQQSAGAIVQVNNNGTFNQNITNLPGATGLEANTLTGKLYSSSASGVTGIYTIDTAAHTSTLFTAGAFDGLTFDPLGNGGAGLLYAANYGDGSVEGFNSLGVKVFDSGFVPGGIDGVGVGSGTFAGLIVVNTNNGNLVEINLATNLQTLLATGGSRGDFVAPDPNGTLLISQSDKIVRLTGGFGGTIPEANSSFFGAAVAVMMAAESLGRRRRRSV